MKLNKILEMIKYKYLGMNIILGYDEVLKLRISLQQIDFMLDKLPEAYIHELALSSAFDDYQSVFMLFGLAENENNEKKVGLKKKKGNYVLKKDTIKNVIKIIDTMNKYIEKMPSPKKDEIKKSTHYMQIEETRSTYIDYI